MLLIGIVGPSGSGKTTFSQQLAKSLGDFSVKTIRLDNYYRCRSHLPLEERKKQNYDCPEAFDFDLLIEHIQSLQAGRSIEMPSFDYASFSRTTKTERIGKCDIIIIEGILCFADKRIQTLFDMRFFIDLRLDLCLARRLKRDRTDRGIDIINYGLDNYENFIMPMCEQYILPQKQVATHLLTSQKQIELDHIRNEIILKINSKSQKLNRQSFWYPGIAAAVLGSITLARIRFGR